MPNRKEAPVSYMNELIAVHDACTCAKFNRSRKRIPKTPAERSRTYRARKKLLKEMERKQNSETNLKISTERSREYRMRKRLANKARAQVNISKISVSGKNTDMNERSNKDLTHSMCTTDLPISPRENNGSVIKDIVKNISKTAAELAEGSQESHVESSSSLFIVENDPNKSMNDMYNTNSSGENAKDSVSEVFPTEQADTKILDGKRRKLVTEAPQASEEASRESYNSEFESYHGLSISPIHIKEEWVENNTGSMVDMTMSSFHQESEREQCLAFNYPKVPPIPRQLVEEDEDLLFFRSLLPHVRKIPDVRKLTFRNRVQDLVDCFAYD